MCDLSSIWMQQKSTVLCTGAIVIQLSNSESKREEVSGSQGFSFAVLAHRFCDSHGAAAPPLSPKLLPLVC